LVKILQGEEAVLATVIPARWAVFHVCDTVCVGVEVAVNIHGMAAKLRDWHGDVGEQDVFPSILQGHGVDHHAEASTLIPTNRLLVVVPTDKDLGPSKLGKDDLKLTALGEDDIAQVDERVVWLETFS